ncbi:amidohydrolase [Mesorhizobium sp. 1B3]|uniref:amidohydrolase n=1 Tax=Mesorhizobium sp. 1B3 TaxID=3243599 RepID=UPI003D98CF00
MTQSQRPATIVLRNGKVLTVDASFRIAEAIAIEGDRIVSVGSDADVDRWTGAETQVIDLEGRTVVPGLVDSHIHMRSNAASQFSLPFDDATCIADMKKLIAAQANAVPTGTWITGSSGWHHNQLSEKRLPNRHDIDDVSPQHPVQFMRNGHITIANSLALKLAGITAETPDPEGGKFGRDADGSPNGILYEAAAWGRMRALLPPFPPAQWAQGLENFARKLNACGITATLEPGLLPDEIAGFMELWRQGRMTTRAHILRRFKTATDARSMAMLAPNFGDDWLKFGGFKFSMDGSTEQACLSEPYETAPDNESPGYHGRMILPQGGLDELREMFRIAASQGWPVQVHALGDETIRVLLDLFEDVNEEYPIADLRWALLHAFLPSSEAIQRMKQLGIFVTVQNQMVKVGPTMNRFWGACRTDQAVPLRSMLAAGIPIGAGTDSPVVSYNPFECIWWMVTRKTLTGAVYGKHEAIDRETALRLYTIDSARVMFWEDKIGSLEVGKLADIAVLSDDYLRIEKDEIRNLTALLTIVGGKVVHDVLS